MNIKKIRRKFYKILTKKMIKKIAKESQTQMNQAIKMMGKIMRMKKNMRL